MFSGCGQVWSVILEEEARLGPNQDQDWSPLLTLKITANNSVCSSANRISVGGEQRKQRIPSRHQEEGSAGLIWTWMWSSEGSCSGYPSAHGSCSWFLPRVPECSEGSCSGPNTSMIHNDVFTSFIHHKNTNRSSQICSFSCICTINV